MFSIYSGYQYAHKNAIDIFGLTPMQVSSLFFVYVSFSAYKKGNTIASIVLLFNFFTSAFLHQKVEIFDKAQLALKIDHIAIASWIVVNCYMLVYGYATNENKYNSVFCAFYTGILVQTRSKFQFRHNYRDAIHCCMHITGSVGTLILL